MILTALTRLYNDLLSRGEISEPGWNSTKVSFALCLRPNGSIQDIVPTTETITINGKPKEVNQTMVLPAPVKRTSGIVPNFLWDNSSYIFGIDGKNDIEKSKKCFKACQQFHRDTLQGLEGITAKSILSFFEQWDPDKCDNNPIFASKKSDLIKGGNIVFRVNGKYAHEDPEIKHIWQNKYNDATGEKVTCLVTGEEDVLELVHPAIKGVRNAQSSGAALVSYNAPAFSSYGKRQGENAPIGKRAAFAYTSALNYLLSDRDSTKQIGDTTVVCWAEGAEPQYKNLSLVALFGDEVSSNDFTSQMDMDTIKSVISRLAEGNPCDEFSLSPSKQFYILGLAPNNARLSVRFFYQNTFGDLMQNVNAHQERLKITGARYSFLPIWGLLRELTNLKSKDKEPNPVLSGAVFRSIVTGSAYPSGVFEMLELRIHAERSITPGRAAILKAYFLKNENKGCPKEVLNVSLNENSTNVPYVIGRLFAVYEAAQQKANPGINATIKDKYFNSAAATPAQILPLLNNLYQKHLRKMDTGSQVYFEKQVAALLSVLGEDLPARLTLPEQGAFQLGYYHQQQKRFEKKEK